MAIVLPLCSVDAPPVVIFALAIDVAPPFPPSANAAPDIPDKKMNVLATREETLVFEGKVRGLYGLAGCFSALEKVRVARKRRRRIFENDFIGE